MDSQFLHKDAVGNLLNSLLSPDRHIHIHQVGLPLTEGDHVVQAGFAFS